MEIHTHTHPKGLKEWNLQKSWLPKGISFLLPGSYQLVFPNTRQWKITESRSGKYLQNWICLRWLEKSHKNIPPNGMFNGDLPW